MSPDPYIRPCLRIHVSAQHLRISGSSARSMCPIHGLAFMSQHLCISGSSARSMSPDPCLGIHMYLRHPQHPILCPCAGETQILTSGDAFCVALRRENSPAESRGSVSRRRNANFDLRRRVLCGLAQGKQSDRVVRAGETQILNCRDEFFVALRRRNANFDLRRRVVCPDHVDSRGVATG